MPARKSNASAVAEEAVPAPKSASREPKDDTLSVEDLNLPKSIVQRLAKGVLPPNTQIQKDALLAMSKSATVFVNYLTSSAAETAARSGKRTVMPKDVFDAMHELEFAFMLPRLEAEVTKFTSIQADKRNTYRKKVREEKKALKPGDTVADVSGVGAATMDADSPRAAKRAKLEEGEGGGSDGEEEVEGEAEDEVDEEVEDDEIEDEEGGEETLVEDALEEKEEKEEKEEDDEMGEDSD